MIGAATFITKVAMDSQYKNKFPFCQFFKNKIQFDMNVKDTLKGETKPNLSNMV